MSLLDEWVDKAEADCAVALHRRRQEPLPDVVCYHCQQCVEKYLKAYLIAQGITPPRIHDLEDLLNLCAIVAEAKDAVNAMRRLRTVVRRKLGL